MHPLVDPGPILCIPRPDQHRSLSITSVLAHSGVLRTAYRISASFEVSGELREMRRES